MRLVVLLAVTYAISGCSWLVHDRTSDYLKAEIKPNIVVPKDVAILSLKPQMAIPDVKLVKLAEEFELPRPEKIVLKKEKSTASLVKVSKQSLQAELVKDGNGTHILRLNVEFARAWSEVGNAIKKSEVSITDLNRSVGTYYIEIDDEETVVEQGFWAGLFGSEPEKVKQALQVKINRARSGVYVAVHIDYDNLADDDQAKSLLASLQRQLLNSGKDKK